MGLAIAASKYALVWWYCVGDDFDVTGDIIKSIPADVRALSDDAKRRLVDLADELLPTFPTTWPSRSTRASGWATSSTQRCVTSPIRVDAILASELGYTELLPALEHAYYCAYKPTGDRPGTLRYDPAKAGINR